MGIYVGADDAGRCLGCGEMIFMHDKWCGECRQRFDHLMKHPSKKMKEMLGEYRLQSFDYVEDYLPLIAINRRKCNGEITAAEAQRQEDAQWERIRRTRNPTPEEFMEDVRRKEAERAKMPIKPNIYDLPSLRED